MRRMLRAVAVATTFTLARMTCPPAFAGDTAAARLEAKKHFQRAVALYEEQYFRASLAEFQRAYELAPNYKLLYNIGQALYQLQSYSKAAEAFEQYLASGNRDIPRARRSEVEDSLVRLRTRVATLTIRVNVAAAEVSVDDQVVATEAGSVTMKVNAGPHRVSVIAKGHVPLSRNITLVGEDNTDLRLDLELEDTTPPAPSPEAVAKSTAREGNGDVRPDILPPREAPRSRTAFYIGLGTTSVLAAGAVGLGITSLVAKGTYDRALRSSADSPKRIDDARTTVRTTSLLADGLAAAAVVGGVATLILYFASGSRSTNPRASAGLHVVRCPDGICGVF